MYADHPRRGMSARLRKPDRRACELCGREEVWDAETPGWRVRHEDGEPVVGSVYCIHEWDIDGDFVPIDDATGGGESGRA
jgi:hypothetical protein